MARAANQKLKCLYLWQFLLQNTDEEHPATIPQMIEYLARHDIPAERKSLYDDIEALRQCGLDVEYRKAQGGGYYVASREFQLPELKLLVDAVQSCKFLSLRKSNALITKLEKLSSRYEAQALRLPGLCHPPGQEYEREHLLQCGCPAQRHRRRQPHHLPLF